MKRAAKKVEEEAFPTDDGFYTDVCGLIQKSVAEVAESSLSLVRSLRNMGDIDFASLLGRKFDSENTLKKRSMQPMYKTTGVKNIRKLITKYIRKSREVSSFQLPYNSSLVYFIFVRKNYPYTFFTHLCNTCSFCVLVSLQLMSGTATNENDEEVPYTLEHLEEAIKKSTRDKLNMWFNNIVLNR